MTLQQLEYVMAVFRYRHFAKAAEHCNVTQPTLSSMVQKLEEELGLRIFDRSRQPIMPTQAGKLIIEQAWSVMVRAKKLRDTAEEQKKSVTGTFNIGVLPTIAPYLVPRFFPKMIDDHPEMDVRITEMKTADIKKALMHGDIDAGILARIDGLDDFVCHNLFYEQFMAYVAATDRLTNLRTIRVADLKDEFLWLLDEGHCFRDQLVKFCKLEAASMSKKAYNLGGIETFMRIVENGKGVTFIPELATMQLTESQMRLVKPFAHPIPTRELVFMTSRHFIRSTLRDIIIERVRRSVPASMLTLARTSVRI